MNLDTLQRIIVESLEDIKAQDIKAYDTTGQTSEFDRVIVATGNSTRQTRASAWRVVQNVKAAGGYVGNIEGADTGEWVLVDLGDIVLHVMVAPVRVYYALEDIWGTRPIAAKPEKPKKKAPTTSQKSASKAPATKTASHKNTAKKTAPAAKKASAKTRLAAKKVAVPKAKKASAASAKKAVTKKPSAKKVLPEKASAKKTNR